MTLELWQKFISAKIYQYEILKVPRFSMSFDDFSMTFHDFSRNFRFYRFPYPVVGFEKRADEFWSNQPLMYEHSTKYFITENRENKSLKQNAKLCTLPLIKFLAPVYMALNCLPAQTFKSHYAKTYIQTSLWTSSWHLAVSRDQIPQ